MKKILATLITVAGLTLGSAYADPVTVNITGASDPSNDGLWVVDVIQGYWPDLIDTLESQIWWGDEALATQFALVVWDHFGVPNAGGGAGPLFGHSVSTILSASYLLNDEIYHGSALDICDCVWGVASRPVSGVPEPGTLGLLSLGLAGIGFARRRMQM